MNPITREEQFMAYAAGQGNPNLTPITRKEMFLAKAGGASVETPTPITREEMFLSQISGGGGGGGGAEINIAYGDTAPEDTSKLWVKGDKANAVSAIRQETYTDGAPITQTYVGTIGGHNFYYSGKLYAIAGGGAVKCYDLSTKKLTTLAVTTTTVFPAAARVGNKVYLFGGQTSGRYTATVERFDLETEQVETLSDMPKIFTDSAAVTIGTKVYFFGGTTNSSYATATGDIRIFDTETSEWSTHGTVIPKIPTPNEGNSYGYVFRMKAVAYGTKAYIFGGWAGYQNHLTDRILSFDTETGEIRELDDKIKRLPILDCGVGVVGSIVYILGGTYYSNKTNIIQSFDMSTEKSSILATRLPSPTSNYSNGEFVDNFIYFIGGNSNSYVTAFNPSTQIAAPNDTLLIVNNMSDPLFQLNIGNFSVIVGLKLIVKGNEKNAGEYVEVYYYKNNAWESI